MVPGIPTLPHAQVHSIPCMSQDPAILYLDGGHHRQLQGLDLHPQMALLQVDLMFLLL